MSDVKQSDRAEQIFSLDLKTRVSMARRGENLDVLMHDSCTMVRREVALRGYEPEVMSKDESNIVRATVAKCGYNTSAAASDTSAIVRQAVNNQIDTKNKYSDKVSRSEQKLADTDRKIAKLGTEKSVHRVRMYSEYDSASGSNRVHVAIDTTKMSREDFAKHKHDNRGLLHKIDSHFQNQNVGLMYARVQKPLRLDENGKRHLQSPITMHSLNTPHFVQSAGKAVWDKGLKIEAGLFRYGDTAKRLIIDPASQAAGVALLNKLNQSSRDNLGLDMAQKGTRAVLSVARGVLNYRRDMMAYKSVRLENKHDKLLKRADKIKLNAATAHSKELFNAANERADNFGLKRSGRKNKPAIKGSWTNIYDGAAGKGYLKSPEKAHLDKKSMSKDEFKHQKKINKLERKEFRMNKKAYEKVKVKQRSFNAATGKFKDKTVSMVDKSKLKKPKPKKPNSLAVRPALAGLGALRNKAFNAMSQNDNAAVQAAAKGTNFAFSEFSKAYKASLQRKDKLYEKRVNKARMKAEKTRAKLEVEKNKNPFSEKSSKKKNKKKAQKKQLRKKRNAEMFKQNMKKAAKKARDEIARKAADFIAGKGKFVALGVLGFILMTMAPMIFLMMMGGGGGAIDAGAVAGVASYTTDIKGLIDFNNQVNALHWQWQSSINDKMATLSKNDTSEWVLITKPCSGGPISNCPNIDSEDYVEPEDNVYKVIKHLYGGERCEFTQYDITCLYAYFTVKYRDEDWKSFKDEFGNFFNTYYELDCKSEYGDEMVDESDKEIVLDVHTTIDCTVNENSHSHTVTTDEHIVKTTEIKKYYRLYPKDMDNPMTIQKYVEEQVKSIGEITENGQTEGERHYEMLMKSLGYHQVIDYPVIISDTDEVLDWSYQKSFKFGSYGVLNDVNEGSTEPGVLADYRYDKETSSSSKISATSNSILKLEAVAGGNGIITKKESNSISIEYPDDKLIITYTCKQRDAFHNFFDLSPTEMTNATVGEKV